LVRLLLLLLPEGREEEEEAPTGRPLSRSGWGVCSRGLEKVEDGLKSRFVVVIVVLENYNNNDNELSLPRTPQNTRNTLQSSQERSHEVHSQVEWPFAAGSLGLE
jgi:hypothetical protein